MKDFFYVLRPGGDDPPRYLVGWDGDLALFSEDLSRALRFASPGAACEGKRGQPLVYEGLNKHLLWSRKVAR